MADIKKAASNVLDTVVCTSNAVCDAVNTVGKTAKYASNYMDTVLAKQEITNKVDMAIFKSTYVEIKAQELTQIRKGIVDWASKNPETQELYAKALAELKASVNPAPAQ